MMINSDQALFDEIEKMCEEDRELENSALESERSDNSPILAGVKLPPKEDEADFSDELLNDMSKIAVPKDYPDSGGYQGIDYSNMNDKVDINEMIHNINTADNHHIFELIDRLK